MTPPDHTLAEASELSDDIRAYVDGLKRRREASRRLPQLDDGTRDPWRRAA